MSLLFQRFADADMERAFVRLERVERGPAIRALAMIAAAGLIAYMIMNPLVFPREGVVSYNIAAAGLVVVLAGLILASRTDFYRDHRWVDLPIFILMDLGMAALVKALADMAAVTGIPAYSMGLAQKGILIVFASIAFAGNVRLYFLWAVTVSALLALWVAYLPVATVSKAYTISNFSIFLIFGLYFNWELDRRARAVFVARAALEEERNRSEELLHNVLPQKVAARLKAGESVADSFADLTVIFADIVDFSGLARNLSPGHLVKLLNGFFSAADRCADRHGVEKVKTIGDAYLAVAGGMSSEDCEIECATRFARDLIADVKALAADTGINLKVRIGIHTGPVVGGVIGSNRLAYDYWGDTMNVAARLQRAAPPNGIAVSEATYFQTRAIERYQPARQIDLKGIGETRVYLAQLDEED
jgi:adenylate cyclase